MRVCFMYQRIARSGLNRVSKRDSGWRWTFWYSLYSTSWCDGNNNKNLLCKIEIQWLSYSKVLELLNIRMSLLVCFLHKRSIPKFPIFLTMASKGWLARDMLPNIFLEETNSFQLSFLRESGILTMHERITAFWKKLVLWTEYFEYRSLEMFPYFFFFFYLQTVNLSPKNSNLYTFKTGNSF